MPYNKSIVMGKRGIFISSVVTTLAALPFSAFAATTNFFGPIIPQSGSCLCDNSAMDWGCVLQVLQNVLNVLVSLGTLVVIFSIAWAGFTLMLSGSNPAARQKAKNRVLNSVVALVLILGAWFIVDTFMKVLYDPTTAFSSGTLGPWNALLQPNNNYCLRINEHPGQLTTGSATGGNIFDILSDIGNPGTIQSNTGTTIGSGDCSPQTLTGAASAANYTLNSSQANTLSCIAKAESACGKNISGATTQSGQPTSAYGMFQIILGANDNCHSLNLSVCTAAAQRAGYSVSGNLNCSQAFSGGRPKPGMERQAAACQAAAADVTCNTSAATCLLQKHPNYSDWTADPRSSQQRACIQKYST